MENQEQIADAMEYFSGTAETKKTMRFKSKDGEAAIINISVSASTNVSEEFWGEIQDRFGVLQEETLRIFS